MHSSIARRAKAGRLFGFVVLFAGFVPVLLFVAQWLLASAGTSRELGWPPLEKLAGIPSPLHAALVIAVRASR